MHEQEIVSWLRENDEANLDVLWKKADSLRKEYVGDAVHLRGLIEISNHCRRSCLYCGIRGPRRQVTRYRMTREEILESARRALELGYGTVVMQAGEDPGLSCEFIADLIRSIKKQTGLAVTLSLGERDAEELLAWKAAGANRYLLRFETSNRALYQSIHPDLPGVVSDRLQFLQDLKKMGYETGGGVMVGIPGQSYEDLAKDLLTLRELGLHMIGLGPYLEDPDTPLGREAVERRLPECEQVPNSEQMGLKAIALARCLCPKTNIPSTTALATLDQKAGREKGLVRGANVVMPNLTPLRYRCLYAIYPAKACVTEEQAFSEMDLGERLRRLGRTVGTGAGNAPAMEGEQEHANATG